jgi:hypothetical protein
MRSTLRNHTAVAVALLSLACAPNTEVVNSWKEPGIPPQRFTKVLAVFITKDPGMRRAAEDQLAHKIGHAVPAYSVVPDSLLRDGANAKAWIKQEGYDGLVIMRPVRVDQEQTFVPGTSYVVPAGYGSYSRYWGTGWGYAYSPGYVQSDQVVLVETNVYSVKDDKLIWASRTKTYNPESVRNLVDEIVDQTAAAMNKEKVIAKS